MRNDDNIKEKALEETNMPPNWFLEGYFQLLIGLRGFCCKGLYEFI